MSSNLTPGQQATLEALERHVIHHGYQALTRRELRALMALRELARGVPCAA